MALPWKSGAVFPKPEQIAAMKEMDRIQGVLDSVTFPGLTFHAVEEDNRVYAYAKQTDGDVMIGAKLLVEKDATKDDLIWLCRYMIAMYFAMCIGLFEDNTK